MKPNLPISERSVRRDIGDFLAKVLKAENTTVVGVLRYGAHLPHFVSGDLVRKPIPVILSHMIEFLPSEVFANGNFLVLDDTVFRGYQMTKCRQRLINRGVSSDRIFTAAVVVHEDASAPDITLGPSIELPNRDYIEWKNKLSSLVRKSLRPIDRDHPLYFFSIAGISPGKLLSMLERYGRVTCQGTKHEGEPFAFSLNISKSVFDEQGLLPSSFLSEAGIDIETLCKIRVYWSTVGGALRVTFVPIVFSEIDIARLIVGRRFDTLVGIPLSELDYLLSNQESWASYVYFLASRSIAALLMREFISDLFVDVVGSGGSLSQLDPVREDYPVQYVFPPSYQHFYERAFSSIASIISSAKLRAEPALRFPWPSTFGADNMQDPRVQQPGADWNLQVLSAVVGNKTGEDPAMFDGKRWVQNTQSTKSASFKSLSIDIDSPLAVSICLDDLLDSGLLRAMDGRTSDDALGTYARLFKSGGEFNAMQVSRLTQSHRASQTQAIEPTIDDIDLWLRDE